MMQLMLDVAHAGEGTSGNEGKCMEMNDMK